MECGSEPGGPVTRAHAGIPDNLREYREAVPPKIFIVEDELVFSEDLRETLEGHGYCVCGNVPTGEEALVAIPEKVPDLVLIDIILAGKMNGIELAEALCASRDIPFIYLTSNIEDETIDSAKCTRPYGYIPKPFDERALFSTIEIALFKHLTDKQIRESEIRYRTFVENIQGIAYRYDRDRVLEFFHGAIEKISGYPAADFIEGRRAWADIIHNDDRDSVIIPDKNDAPAFLKNRSQEYRIVRKDGKIRWIHDQTRIVCRAPASPPLFEGVIYDITPLKVLETDLRKACDIRTLILLMSGHFFRRFVKNGSPGNSTKDQHALASSLSEILEGVGYEMGIHIVSLYQRTAGTDGLPWYRRNCGVSTRTTFLLLICIVSLIVLHHKTGWPGGTTSFSKVSRSLERSTSFPRKNDRFYRTCPLHLLSWFPSFVKTGSGVLSRASISTMRTSGPNMR